MGKTPAVKLSDSASSSQGQFSLKQPPPPSQSSSSQEGGLSLGEASSSSSSGKSSKIRRPTSNHQRKPNHHNIRFIFLHSRNTTVPLRQLPEGYNPRRARAVPNLHEFRLVRGVLVLWRGDPAAHTKPRVRSHRNARLLRFHGGLECAGGAHPSGRYIVCRDWQLEGGRQADRVKDGGRVQAALPEGLLFVAVRTASRKESFLFIF